MRLPLLTALLTTSTLATASFAQTQPAATRADEGDIIVTAQKREENLQDVPISIQALGTQKLDELNVSDFNDFTKVLPSVSFQTLQPGFTTVYIRGVASGGDGNHSGSLPSVGFYLDEQPVTTIGGTLDVHIYDIARIEALAGPQGTLYGASSEAGTVRIITNKPDPSGFEGSVDAEVNTVRHGGEGGKLEGFVNIPLGERAAVRLVGFYQHDAGFIDNVPGTRNFLGGLSISNPDLVEDDFNDVDTVGGRAALGIDLDEDWTVTASVFGQDMKANGVFGFDPQVGDLKVQHFFPDRNHDRFVQAALTIEGKIGNWDLTYAGAYLKRKRNTANDYTDYAEAYDALYADYNGYHGLAEYFYYQDNAGNNVIPTQFIVASDNFDRISQELRIASPAENPFRVVAGLFYQRQSNDIFQDYRVPNLGAQVSVNGRPGTLWLTKQERVDRDYAIFGEASYDITPQLTVTGGLRGYKFNNSLVGFFGFGRNPAIDPDDGRMFTGRPFNAAGSSRTGVAGCFTEDGRTVRQVLNESDDPVVLLPPLVEGTFCTDLADFVNGKLVPKRTKDTGVTYRANVTWKPSDDQLFYATISRGFRPGGINRRADIVPYRTDTLTNYELGFKTNWDGGVRFNGAFYWQDWKNFQYSFLGANSFTEIHNGPSARIKGIEADFAWNPRNGFTLSATAAYTDAKIRNNLCGFDDPSFECTLPGATGEVNFIASPKGTRLPVTPKFKFSTTARYEHDFGGVRGHVQAVVSHSGSASSDLRVRVQRVTVDEFDPVAVADPASYFLTQETTGRLAAYTTADFAVGAEWQNLMAELFIQNAFDERAQLSRYQECGQCFQRPYIVTNTPRTIGLRAGYRF